VCRRAAGARAGVGLRPVKRELIDPGLRHQRHGLRIAQRLVGELQRLGRRRASLGVITGSETGAARLFELAGMRVDRKLVTYEKEIRAGREPGTESV